MKRFLLLLAVTLCCSPILDAQQVQPKILNRKPIVSLVPRSRLPEACGTRHVEACTAFVGQRLICHCEERDGGWTIAAHAQFIPLMYVMNGRHLAHERDHIEDIETSLAEYLDVLEQRRFATLPECERTASAEMSQFPRTMDGFKLRSNAKRHPR